MNSKKFLANAAFFFSLIAITFFLIFKDGSFYKAIDIISGSEIKYIIYSFLLMFLYIFCGGYCIKVMFSYMQKKMSVHRSLKYSFIEFFFSAITPSSTGGQPMQVVSMSQDGYDSADSTVTLIIIAFLYRLTLIILTALVFMFNFSFASSRISDSKIIFFLGLFLNLGFAVLLLSVLFSKKFVICAGKLLIRFICFLKIKNKENMDVYFKKLEGYSKKYHDCAKFMMTHPKLVIRSFVILSVQRISILSIPCFVYKALGFSDLSFFEIFSVQTILSICVDILPFPGSVGISEAMFLKLYEFMFKDKVIAATLLCRGINFYLIFIISSIVVLFVFINRFFKSRKKSKEKSV